MVTNTTTRPVQTKFGGVPLNPRLHLAAIYTDAEEATIVVYWYFQGRGLPISWESAARILSQAKHSDTIRDSDGYDEDPTARIYFLHRNEYVNLLRPEEREAVFDFQAEFDPPPRPPLRRSVVTGRFKGGGGKYQ